MLKVADEDGTMTEIEVSLKKELTVSAASQWQDIGLESLVSVFPFRKFGNVWF
jgi:hypothetical protein